MTERLVIEKGIPMPNAREVDVRKLDGRPRDPNSDVSVLCRMEVGDSVLFPPGKTANQVSTPVTRAKARSGYTFRMRTLWLKGQRRVRVWRAQ